ncbi:MAG: GNAT family N-acetyltransferase [Bdellovibrionales bacterium]
MQTLVLPKSGQTARIGVLGPEHLSQTQVLLAETRAALPEAEKMFVLPQPQSYFENLLARRNGVLLGVTVGDQVVAQMAVMGAMTLDEAIDRNAITRNDVYFHHAVPRDVVAVAKSMSVHPAWRGNALAQIMLKSALDLPMSRAADHMFAQASVDNMRSWSMFLRQGFGVVAAAVDPSDHKPRFVLQRPALGFGLREALSVEGVSPTASFAAIMRLTGREALIGTLAPEGISFDLSFYASETSAAAWSDEEQTHYAGAKGF